MGTESVVPNKAPLPTPKAIIHQKFGTKAVYKTEEVKESAQNVCPGLAIPQQGPSLFRCTLELPDVAVTSDVCKRKKDAEQSAAQIAIEKLGIKTGINELTVKELCDELVTRVSYVFSDEFLPSPHPLTGHLRAALTRRGHLKGLVHASILAACDQKVNNLCKSINRKVETDHLLSIPLIMKAATLSGSVATDEGKLWIRKQNQYSPETIEAVTNGNPSAENICVQAIRIPCSLEKPVQPLSLNISSKEYYVDVIAEKLGVADASHFCSSWVYIPGDADVLLELLEKSSLEMRVYFSPLGLPLKTDSTLEDLSYETETLNLRASYFSGQNIHGEAILATFGYTWKCTDLFHEDVTLCTYYRMLVDRLPDGGYKLSRDAVIAADLPTAFTTRTNWRGSYPRDLLSTFCRLHWLPEPEFSTTCVNDANQSPTKKQKIEETANGGAVEAHSREVIMGSGSTFKCDVKIVSTSHDVILECSPGDCYKRQGDAVQSTSLKVLLWLNKYFKQLDVPMEKWSPSENNALGVRVYPKNFLKAFAICASIHTVQHASILSKDSMGLPNRVEELVEMNRHYNIVSPPKIEGLDSGVSPSNGSLVCISYDISLVREGVEDVKETLESCEEFEFEIGSGFVVPQIETCFTQMSAGQSAFFITELPHQLLVLSSAGGCAKSLTSLSLKDCVLKYSINLLRVQEPLEDRMEQALFSPPLSKQRVEYAVKHINESCAATLVDFGCGSGALLDSLLDYPITLEKIVGVDISRSPLYKLSAVHGKDSPLSSIKAALLYDGSITTFDTRLYGFDIGTCLEVIEHMQEDEACAFGNIALSTFCPKILIVSTPNYEYNPILQKNSRDDEADEKNSSLPCKFRNHDHKFEWTREQFSSWASDLASRHNYSVEFRGVGGIGDVEPGFASQIAVFRRKSQLPNPGDLAAQHYEVPYEWSKN
ncbi:hypothetical protein C5167_041297 [Papaver somniferum]|uniref:Small RNA 2'-O-methyltransferase n=1 Tax=Papaver somniferum TaxID=3469 RepID=A0A4Y7IHI1_PAPSO|nr:hypothetical protein C5167_041297 [Papaver somniferum]